VAGRADREDHTGQHQHRDHRQMVEARPGTGQRIAPWRERDRMGVSGRSTEPCKRHWPNQQQAERLDHPVEQPDLEITEAGMQP